MEDAGEEMLVKALVERMYEIDGKRDQTGDKYGMLWDAILDEVARAGFSFEVSTRGDQPRDDNRVTVEHVA